MKEIFLFTQKYFYAREITEFLSSTDIQILSYWKQEEFLSVIKESSPWAIIIDYEIGEVDWNKVFNILEKIKIGHF